MATTKLPRLLAAAKEFNTGQDTIIEFLITKGFPKDELKPTSKLTEEMYEALRQQFGKGSIKGTAKPTASMVGMRTLYDAGAELKIDIDPGTAPDTEIARVLAELSLLFREAGGTGIEFKFDHVTLNQGEVI